MMGKAARVRYARKQRAYQKIRRDGLVSFFRGMRRMVDGPVPPPLSAASLEANLRDLWADIGPAPTRLLVSRSTVDLLRRAVGVRIRGARGRVWVHEVRGRWKAERV